MKLLDRLVDVEIIGQPECPLMLRWLILDVGFLRAMFHYFSAEVTDRDPHDHPRPFFTFVLRGRYVDTSWRQDDHQLDVVELVEAGQVIYRPAAHLHIVETQEVGCWTFVVMGPLVREWGFVRLASAEWWPWGKYIQRFGGVVRCDAPPDKMGVEPEVDFGPHGSTERDYRDYKGTHAAT